MMGHVNDNTRFNTQARNGGEVQIGEGALVGIGAMVLPHCRIGSWSVVGGGAVVLNDLLEVVVAVGVPIKVVRYVEKGVSNEKQ